MWIFYWPKRAERDASRREATRRGAGDLQRHVGNCIRLRRNGKERIYRNKLPPRSRDWISVTERRIFRARTAKIIDDVSRGCLMEVCTRAPRFRARKETESNSSEWAREPRWYVLHNIHGAAVRALSSCQFRNIVSITDVTLHITLLEIQITRVIYPGYRKCLVRDTDHSSRHDSLRTSMFDVARQRAKRRTLRGKFSTHSEIPSIR